MIGVIMAGNDGHREAHHTAVHQEYRKLVVISALADAALGALKKL